MKNSCDPNARLPQPATRHSANLLEVVSKPQIRLKRPAKRDYMSDYQINECIKASRELETERAREYVSISIRGTTQPLEPFELLK